MKLSDNKNILFSAIILLIADMLLFISISLLHSHLHFITNILMSNFSGLERSSIQVLTQSGVDLGLMAWLIYQIIGYALFVKDKEIGKRHVNFWKVTGSILAIFISIIGCYQVSYLFAINLFLPIIYFFNIIKKTVVDRLH